MDIDFHIHTVYSSDGLITLKELKALQSKRNLLFAITDHNTTKAHRKAKALGISFIPGEEIRTADGDVIALFIQEEIKPFLSLEETLDLIEEQGGISYAPHPFSLSRHSIGEKAALCDVVEVFNSHNTAWEDDKAFLFAEERGKLKAAGSDAHMAFEVGRAYVSLPLASLPSSPSELLKALKSSQPHISKRRDIIEWALKRIKVAEKRLREL